MTDSRSFAHLSVQTHEGRYKLYYSALLSYKDKDCEDAHTTQLVLEAILAFGKIPDARKKLLEKEVEASHQKNLALVQKHVWDKILGVPPGLTR